ncbi:MAG: sigma-70 family RNA polymerase sigma factor [Acidobacteriota bacterium]|nr:sigma-70 family RNA polymerase sigma factor [Acidobacteriota bacterium]
MPVSILQRIAAKDKTAAQECLSTYGGLVWSLARRMCPNVNDAEDAVQEIFIDIWKNAERFDAAQASETTFIAMIARRRLIDRLRKSQRQPQVNSIEEMTVEPARAQDKQMQASVEAKQAAEAMNALRPEQRRVLQLSIYQGMSHQEIADATGMPIGTVKSHARRGLMQIREVLGLGESRGGSGGSGGGGGETKGVVA